MSHAVRAHGAHPLTAPKAVTLFSGVGGSSKALRDLGYSVQAHDFMPEAVASLRANGFIAEECDVREVDWTSARYADIKVLEGGPPCQPFSQSHEGDGQYDPRDMIPEFLRAIDGLQPEVFVMEEVQTLTWAKHKAYFAKVIGDMEALGYVVDYKVLNAADYFIGQARKRLIVIGIRADIAEQRWMTGFKPAWPVKSTTQQTMAQVLGWTEQDCLERNRQVPDPRAHVADTDDYAKCLWPMERPGVTVVGSFRPEVQAAPGYRVKGDPPRQGTPGSVVCTLEERLLLQDFPSDWIVCGPQDKRDLQVGNSVPVGFMREIIAANTGRSL